jgi:purine nucleosidase
MLEAKSRAAPPCVTPQFMPIVPEPRTATMGRMKNPRFLSALVVLALVTAGSAKVNGQASAAISASSQQLVILDTDIGDDIDDAFALALVLRSPELRLLGIETAFGDTELRARLVDRYLAAVARTDIPVLAGVETKEIHFTQAAYARQWPSRKHPDAVAFLLDQIRAHPGQITLIAIGPLFNIEAAIAKDPVTFRKLKRVVIMGGSVYRGYDAKDGDRNSFPSPEWNILCDPEGAKALLGSGVPVFVMPLDSTQIHLENPSLGMVFAHGSPLTDQLTLLYHQWTAPNEWRSPTLFDPVAVTYAVRPDLCPVTPMRLEVDDKGFTRPIKGAPNAQVCLHADEKGFLELLLNRITEQTAH